MVVEAEGVCATRCGLHVPLLLARVCREWLEGEIEYVSGMGWIIKHNGDVRAIPDLGRGLVAALLQHRQRMEG